jgi:hypothetical protein
MPLWRLSVRLVPEVLEDVISVITVGTKERILADIGDHHGDDLAAMLEDAEDGKLAGFAAFQLAFANAAKMALIDLDEPFEG